MNRTLPCGGAETFRSSFSCDVIFKRVYSLVSTEIPSKAAQTRFAAAFSSCGGNQGVIRSKARAAQPPVYRPFGSLLKTIPSWFFPSPVSALPAIPLLVGSL